MPYSITLDTEAGKMFGWQEVLFGLALAGQLGGLVAALENKKVLKAWNHFCFVHDWFDAVEKKGVWRKEVV